ncbi:hypothetical protein [Oricola sp.]|uniref:hypothetical protein n=1 Tax=Oricola sp. TaxID=1979950 RepID=UPI003516CAFF
MDMSLSVSAATRVASAWLAYGAGPQGRTTPILANFCPILSFAPGDAFMARAIG